MKQRFLALYNTAFSQDGEILACGREVCRELICIADQIEREKKHGNPTTGMMDVDAIKLLYSNIANDNI